MPRPSLIFHMRLPAGWCQQVGAIGPARGAIAKCMDGLEGPRLMRQNANMVTERGMYRSCTIAIEGRVRCIRDSSRW